MKAIKIQMPVTPYVPADSVIAKICSLGASAFMIAKMKTGRSRSQMVRDTIPTRSFLEWAGTFEGETEIMYVRGTLSGEVDRLLGDLRARQVIDAFEVVNLR